MVVATLFYPVGQTRRHVSKQLFFVPIEEFQQVHGVSGRKAHVCLRSRDEKVLSIPTVGGVGGGHDIIVVFHAFPVAKCGWVTFI
jgi:hypothetical protein